MMRFGTKMPSKHLITEQMQKNDKMKEKFISEKNFSYYKIFMCVYSDMIHEN